MNKKLIFMLIISIFILTGCSSEYNLEFSNGKIKENIVVNILDSDIPKQPSSQLYEADDRVTPFIKNDQYPFFGNEDIVYKKNVEKSGTTTKVTLDYTYTHDEYLNSTVYKSCFDRTEFSTNKRDYELNFSGNFYCLYGDELVINIKSNNKVISSNADKVSDNVYTWVINKDNVNDVDIQIKISKTPLYIRTIIYIILGIVFVVLLVFGFNVYNKIKNKDSVNEI